MKWTKYNKKEAHLIDTEPPYLLIINDMFSPNPKYVTGTLHISYPESKHVSVGSEDSSTELDLGEPRVDWTIDEFEPVDAGSLGSDLYKPMDVNYIEILAYAPLLEIDYILHTLE